MGYQTPKIAQDVRRLRWEIENAVRGFPRFHRYQSGTELREQVKVVQRTVNRAWTDKDNPDRQAQWLNRLEQEIDQLKADMQLAQDIRAFNTPGQFRHLYVQAGEIGRQAHGWRMAQQQKHPSAQNPQGRRAVAERGRTLSTDAAPARANS
ncbi:four helix bundle protein [Solilutibacter silvestris]|uniref:four helix bundle protein n=1 Tax=Solilutibacter silvestris TaxID=1645665 RepID=UPI003D33A271